MRQRQVSSSGFLISTTCQLTPSRLSTYTQSASVHNCVTVTVLVSWALLAFFITALLFGVVAVQSCAVMRCWCNGVHSDCVYLRLTCTQRLWPALTHGNGKSHTHTHTPLMFYLLLWHNRLQTANTRTSSCLHHQVSGSDINEEHSLLALLWPWKQVHKPKTCSFLIILFKEKSQFKVCRFRSNWANWKLVKSELDE